MYSDVRLVIWDLDETFWDGTLCEGGITYNSTHHNIIKILCERGIMSSICSRNDLVPVETILREKGIWDYFIFPSIDWTSKADRVARIIATAQLRPETVLFVDDNPGNRGQVKAAIPGIQIADRPDIAGFLDDPGFRGKSDPDLTRLKQYKVLEERQSALTATGGDDTAFLRQSGIVVDIIYDVEQHIDRAVELVNRTNQLNFTKRRLSDDPAAARAELLEDISLHHAKAGLVSVRDRYGDYGICGFFLVHGLGVYEYTTTVHFAFSCRCLGMGVEQWVYDLIGRPEIKIVGDVASSLDGRVDWINTGDGAVADGVTAPHRFREIRLRGGCELEVLTYYFRSRAENCLAELVTPLGSFNRATHSSAVLARGLLGLSDEHRRALKNLKMDPAYFETQLFTSCKDGTVLVYSPSTDTELAVYRHKKSGLEMPIFTRYSLNEDNPNRTRKEIEEFDRIRNIAKMHYQRLPQDDFGCYLSWYRTIVEHAPKNALLIIVLPNYLQNKNGVPELLTRQATLNELFKMVGKDLPNIRFVETTSLLEAIDDVKESFHLHFRRAVYHRLYETIERLHDEWLETIYGAKPRLTSATAAA